MMADLLMQLDSLWQRCHFPDPGGLRILGLRGCDVVDGQPVANDGAFDRFRDTLFLFDPAAGRIDHVPCTAGQPGGYWDTMAGANAPWVRPNCALYTRGIHRGEYPCLVQAGSLRATVPVIRDVSGTPGVPSYSGGDFDYALNTGIHIHHSAQQNEPAVGIWSDGCTVVDDGDGPLWTIVKAAVWGTYAAQETIWYGIAPFAWLGDSSVRLLMGSVDKADSAVTLLQQFLNTHDGSSLAVTGQFNQETDEEYRSRQRGAGETGDGVCTNPSFLPAPTPPQIVGGQVAS